MNHYDLFVIGAGSGGVRAARMAAATGAKVAVAESRYYGGTCVNVGCVPKKLFVYASEFGKTAANSKGFGWEFSKPDFDWKTLISNKNSEIERLNGIYANILGNSGAEIIDGQAILKGDNRVEVDGTEYTADRILVAVGGWPVKPEIPGSDLAITSNEFFFLDELPSNALVVGGGYIAVEFAGILNGLGVATNLNYRGDQLLRGFDHDVRTHLTNEIDKSGISLDLGRAPTSIVKTATGYQVDFNDGESIDTDLVVFATGRSPLTQGLGIENTGIETDARGAIVVNEFFETTQKGVFALGDVINRVQLTPVALQEAMCFVNNEFTDKPKQTMDYQNIASAVFSQPSVATVGLTEEQAKSEYQDIAVFRSEFRALKETISGAQTRTLMKIIVDKASDKVLGMHMVGDHSGEIIQGFAAAIKMGVTKSVLDSTIGIHPTSAEEFVTMRTPVE
jgi:glutathione reductase (NADPH)